jgi:cytochrome P450
MMLMKDDPKDHRLRVLGNHAFTLSALRRWQGVIERVVDDLAQRWPQTGPRRHDHDRG